MLSTGWERESFFLFSTMKGHVRYVAFVEKGLDGLHNEESKGLEIFLLKTGYWRINAVGKTQRSLARLAIHVLRISSS